MAEVATLFATSAGTATAASGAAAAAGSTLPWLSAAGSFIGPPTATASALGTFSNAFTGLASLSTLTTGLSLASMAGDLYGSAAQGRAASEQLRLQAEQDFLTAKQDELQGKQQQNDIMQNLLQTVANQRLAYSGAGIDFSFGTPDKLEQNMTTLAERQLGTSRDNTRMNVLSRRRNAYNNLSQRRDAQMQPVINSISRSGEKLMGMLR